MLRLDVAFTDGTHDTTLGSADRIELYLAELVESGRANNITTHAFSAA